MNGQNILGNNWNRRDFILASLQSFALFSIVGWSCSKPSTINCYFAGADSQFGHILRDYNNKNNITISSTIEIPLAILGGGISGLTTAYYLNKNNFTDFIILDSQEKIGGNAISGKNEFSEYPYGAHYLTLPNLDNEDLISFLDENGFIEGYDNANKPIYKEEHICHDPQERLFIKNKWQEGLVPNYSLNESDINEISRFEKMMDDFKGLKNDSGKFVFNIPIANSYFTAEILELDKITFLYWLKQNNFHSEYLYWFLNYGVKDDYGTVIDDISALVGIHYFASRRGEASFGVHNTILTWPEGNNKIVKTLLNKIDTAKLYSNCICIEINEIENKIELIVLNGVTNKYMKVITEKVVLATPQYINKKIFSSNHEYHSINSIDLEYSPWLVANITLKNIDEQPFVGLCWDNVIYGSDSLGYVYAQHQSLAPVRTNKVITWYYPITHKSGKDARNFLRSKDETFWKNKIIEDLKIAHVDIEKDIINIELWEWGHAMVKPLPNIISKTMNNPLKNSIRNKYFFCHSDLSGISLFEEAFFHGIRSAKLILNS